MTVCCNHAISSLTLSRDTGELYCFGDAAAVTAVVAVGLLALRGDATLLLGLA
jgi:hypothetical protein